MDRTTIDFGIDLGTTNSVIGVFRGVDVEIIKNNNNSELTPSAVWCDTSGAMVVGHAAKQRVESDPKNARAEFKLGMGVKAPPYTFERIGRPVKPEDLSAEVLKALKASVQQRLREEVVSAVITIPAEYPTPACEATGRAASLAGINFYTLMQEPVAAALSYGFLNASDKVFWLVYDLGGGTFDAAIVQVRDGMIRVVGHGGDLHLGGKNIDWAIVEEILIPELLRQYRLTDFRRGNLRWMRAIAKLKQQAEEAKILLSANQTATVSVDFEGEDQMVDFNHVLRRADIESLAEPFILSSINICRQVLAEKRLRPDHIEKVILVGGPTLMPYLRQHLADPQTGLGAPLDYSFDPLTVVARGAAIFAGTQRNEGIISAPLNLGHYAIDLSYAPVGMDQEFPVGGRVTAGANQSLAGYTLVFVNETLGSTWRSGSVAVTADGRFMTKLWAEKGKPNTFRIELRDASSNKCQIEPDHLSYSFGLVPDNPILIHTIGIALANNEVRVFVDKGTPLPVRKRFDLKLAHRISRSATGEAIRIPVVEGEHKRADRNWLIGYLEIPATKLTRDLPAGAQIEVTLKIDQSRQVKAEAHITMLNVEYEAKLNLEREVSGPAQLREDVEQEKKRLEEVRNKARIYASTDPITTQLLNRIEGEQVVEKVESNLNAAQADQDAADKCQNQLLSLKAMLDDLEEATAVPRMLAEAQEMIDWTFEVVSKLGRGPDQLKYEQYESEMRAAMEPRGFNRAELARLIDQMDGLRVQILMARNEWWLEFFAALEEQREMMTDQDRTEKIFGQARRAIENNDFQRLKDACKQLVQLLPVRQQETVGRFRSNVI